MSTTYYALFHCLAECCADTLIGKGGRSRYRPNLRYRLVPTAENNSLASFKTREIVQKVRFGVEDVESNHSWNNGSCTNQ